MKRNNMKGFDWFGLANGLAMGLLAIVYIWGCVYEWNWLMRWRNPLLHLFGWEKTRFLYLFVGFGGLGIGTALMIHSTFTINSLNAFLSGFAFSAVVTKLIYESREGQSIGELIQFKAKRKPKSKHGEEE